MRNLFVFLILLIICFLMTPVFCQTTKHKKALSLNEAILLAVRTNPNVVSTRLGYLSQKFNLRVQEWQFEPHFSFQSSIIQTRTGTPNNPIVNSHTWNATPAATLVTPIGTQLNLTMNNQKTSHYNPSLSLQVIQPLMKGFGPAVVESALYNAQDSVEISKLGIEGSLRTTITNVINGYLDVVMAERTMKIDEEALKRAELSVTQTRLFIKAGHKAGNELVTVEANVASAKSQLENDRNLLLQARYALLAAIGIDPNTEVDFESLDVMTLIQKYHLPTLEDAKHLILKNDIQYQVDNITLHGSTSRNLLIANDNTRWQLNVTAGATTGGGSGGGQNAGVDSLFNGANQSQNIGLTLQIPIDDQLAKQAVVNAKIALQQAELGLKQEKWNKQTNAINGWNAVISAERALKFAEDAEKLQEKTYDVGYQKYLHGLIDSLELQSAQLQLIQSQQTLLNTKISYLKALVNMDLLIGQTLSTWDVKVRL